MKTAYPVALEPCAEGGFTVHLHDFGNVTEGSTEYEALKMARDALQAGVKQALGIA